MGRAVIIVLDSLGVGHLPDADQFGDVGAHTLGHINEHMDGLAIPNMIQLGLYNIDGIGQKGVAEPQGCFGKCAERSAGKDTSTGHFEIAGLIVDKPAQVFETFPERILKDLESKIGRKTIGNYPASGTQIIQELGDEHVRIGSPIVYTSADSLMQIAMHEGVIPIEEQYRICKTAREILMGDDFVTRIICRPFVGGDGVYTRTENRKDFAVDPPDKTVLNLLEENGKDVIAVGKIEDIFNRSGITRVDHTKNNAEGIEATIRFLGESFDGLLFTNLVDFDMLYGHRRDPVGYGKALEYFDAKLPEILAKLRGDDVLIITADHGCDPTYAGTDHTREYTPLLIYGPHLKQGVNLGTRDTFADIAQTVADYFGLRMPVGTSVLGQIR